VCLVHQQGPDRSNFTNLMDCGNYIRASLRANRVTELPERPFYVAKLGYFQLFTHYNCVITLRAQKRSLCSYHLFIHVKISISNVTNWREIHRSVGPQNRPQMSRKRETATTATSPKTNEEASRSSTIRTNRENGVSLDVDLI
jgi:hypothetical protein